MSAINKNLNLVDIPCSKRDAIDQIVNQVGEELCKDPVYSKFGLERDGTNYKYFGSDMSHWVSRNDDLRDKGRFVNACIVYYLYGSEGLKKLCARPNKIRPRDLTAQDKLIIETTLAEMPAAKGVESSFVPKSEPMDSDFCKE